MWGWFRPWQTWVAKLHEQGYQVITVPTFTLFKWRSRCWFPLGSKILWKSLLDPEAVPLSSPTAAYEHSPPASHLSMSALWTAVSLLKEGQLGTNAERHPECRKTPRLYKEMYLSDHSPPPPSIHTRDTKSEQKFDRTGDSVVEVIFFFFLSFSFTHPLPPGKCFCSRESHVLSSLFGVKLC